MFIDYYLFSCGGFKKCSQILCYSFFQEMEFNSFPLECGLCSVTCFQTENGGLDKVWLPRLGHKRQALWEGGKESLGIPPCPFSWKAWSGGSHLTSWRHSSSLTERFMWQEIEASCQQPGEWTILEADTSDLIKTLDAWSSSQHTDYNLMRYGARTTSKTTPKFMTRKNCKTINVCCFKPLNF